MAFFEEMRLHKVRTLKTCMLCFIFVGLGLTVALPGPTILDLQLAADCTLVEIARILPARAGGYAVGAILTGFLLDYFDHQVVLLVFLLSSSIAFLIVPLLGNITWMCVFMMINGLGTGAIDTCGNVWLIHLWGKANPPFMQTLHFAYGVGAFIAPFIGAPFLLPLKEEVIVNNPVNPLDLDLVSDVRSNSTTSFWSQGINLMTTLHDRTVNGHWLRVSVKDANFSIDGDGGSDEDAMETTESPLIDQVFRQSDVLVHWSFAIVTIYNLFIWIVFLAVYLTHRSNKQHPSRLTIPQSVAIHDSAVKVVHNQQQQQESGDDHLVKSYQSLPVLQVSFTHKRRLAVIILSTLFMHVYCAVEISFGSLLAPFTVKSNLNLSKASSSFITSAYWFTFTAFRVLSLVAINYCKPRTLLLFDMLLIMGSNAILLPLGDSCLWALWLGVALMGLGCSSVFATMIGYVEEMFPLSSRITSGFMVAACLGEFFLPSIVSMFIETNPRVYLYVVFAYSLASLIFLLAIIIVQHGSHRRLTKHVHSDDRQQVQQ